MYTKNCNPKTMNRAYTNLFGSPVKFENYFGDLLAGTGIETSYGTIPAVNIKESEKEFTLELVAAGFEKEEVKLKLENDVLVVSGEKKTENSEEKEGYTRREFKAGKFTRRFSIPENVNTSEIKAEFKNGILFIALPKKGVETKPAQEIVIN